MKSPESKNLPVGTGEKFQEERRKETLPATEVRNTVVWVNPAFKEAPFELTLGKETKLGLFFSPQPSREIIVMPEPGSGEGRSGLIGSVVFRDKEDRLYRDVDIKGMGFFVEIVGAESYERDTRDIRPGRGPQEMMGLMDYELALRDRNFSEKFLKAGIRTHRVLAIVDLEEIFYRGKKISVEAAQEDGIMGQEIHPVLEVRAFGTKERIDYLQADPQNPPERREQAFLDAKAMVAQELGRDPSTFSVEEYITWFARTLGKQVATLRKLKLVHRYLSTHNITLDCRIVDLDSVIQAKEKLDVIADEIKAGTLTEDLVYDMDKNDARGSLSELYRQIYALGMLISIPLSQIENYYDEAYRQGLQTKTKR